MCVHVPCTFYTYGLSISYNKRIYGFWFRGGSSVLKDSPVATNDPSRRVQYQAKGRFHLTGDPRMNNCSLSITDAWFSDRRRYFFRIDYQSDRYSFVNQLLYVNVTGLTQKPDITIPEMLESGNPVTLKCTFPSTCGQDRPFTFSWIGASLFSKTQSSRTSPSSQFSFISGPQHHGTNLTCQVTLPGGRLSTKRTVQLNLSCFVPANSSALVVQERQSLHLLCAANSNPPATLNGGNYTFLAQHPLGSKQASLSISVNCECEVSGHHGLYLATDTPRLLSPSCSWVKEGLICTCCVQAEPPTSLLWWVGGKPVEDNSSNDTFQVTSTKSVPWANSSLNVKVDRVSNITISCEGKNHQRTHTLLCHLVPGDGWGREGAGAEDPKDRRPLLPWPLFTPNYLFVQMSPHCPT
ncbi:sialic acid-binding Ig-like lectin 5 [Notamacropus eugenii]|uniref:sialic acid-binding Ig-like lectin 5 n=1 Tax=Notamacropus eugenii TaxID=9315 RepID=UPI003B67D1F9